MSLTAVIAIGAAACGGSGDSGTGGKGGAAGGKGGSGAGGGGGGSKGGSGPGGAGATGGGKGGGGAAGGAAAIGGTIGGGGVGGAGNTGGMNPCGETKVCTVPAVRCNAGAPQTCALDAMGCEFWTTTPMQPATCSMNQTCDAATGTCKCNDAPGCGTPPKAGEFCTTANGATKSTCTMGADGCFTVATAPCAAGLNCATAVGMVVPASPGVCGCTPAAADQTGDTVKLLGTGCTDAEATAMARKASKADDAILVCKKDATCATWQLSVACAAQQLTGGVVNGMPVCVCKPPAKAGQYYVDPDPAMSNFMNGPPTGAQFPQACRLRTLTTALASTTVPAATEVIAQHEQSSNVHFLTNAGLPGVSSCDSPNSCEKFPINIPAGVHVYTADVGSFNPAHYVVDIDDVGSTNKYAVLLGSGSILEGYTLDASGTNTNGVNAAANLVAVVITPISGVASATMNQVLVLTHADLPGAITPSANTHVGVLIRGQSVLTASYLSVIGGRGTKTGILLDHATDNTAGAATLAAKGLNVSLVTTTGAQVPQVAVQLGTNGATNGINDHTAATIPADVGNTVTVTNDAVDTAAGRKVLVSGNGTAFLVYNGSLTTTGVDVGSTASTSVPGPLTGYNVLASKTPAAMAVNINQGTINAAGSNGGNGVLSTGGLTTVNGTHITGLQSGGFMNLPWTGVNVQSFSATVAGDVTLTGTTALNTVIDTAVLAAANATSAVGVSVGLGTDSALVSPTTLSRLTIADHVTVGATATTGGFFNGVVVNNGRFVSTGTDVKVNGNWNDGIQLLGKINPLNLADPLGQGTITGASITANRRLGIQVNDTVPAALSNVTVTGNGTATSGTTLSGAAVGGGIDVIQSQSSAQAGYLFKLTGSKINNNNGCGVSLTGGNSVAGGVAGKRVCGVALATEGGKVSADIETNTISGNLYVGLYVTEASIPTAASAPNTDTTEVILQSNTVTGNLAKSNSILDAVEPIAGGIYFAASTANPAGTLTTADTDSAACTSPAVCTRVRAEKFLGNTVSCNGRHELGYGIPQRLNANNATAWDIGSAAASVDMAMACSATAFPNTLTGYGGAATGMDLGLAVTSAAIRINALGVHWMNAVPAAGVDYSAYLGVAPTGNNDAAAPGVVVAPAKGFVFCPASAATPACGG